MAESRITVIGGWFAGSARWLRGLAGAAVVMLVAGCGGGEGTAGSNSSAAGNTPTVRALAATEAPASLPDIAVVGLTKIRETRIGRTEFEYEFTVAVSNYGAPADDVKAILSGVPTGTRVIDGEAKFGLVARTRSQGSRDTITVRQDRTVPFAFHSLRWAILLAPTANPAAVDADSNGVRDDVDALMSKLASGDPRHVAPLLRVARSMQSVASAMLPIDEVLARALILEELYAGACLVQPMQAVPARNARESLFWGTFDTRARRQHRQAVLQSAGAFVLPEELPVCN